MKHLKLTLENEVEKKDQQPTVKLEGPLADVFAKALALSDSDINPSMEGAAASQLIVSALRKKEINDGDVSDVKITKGIYLEKNATNEKIINQISNLNSNGIPVEIIFYTDCTNVSSSNVSENSGKSVYVPNIDLNKEESVLSAVSVSVENRKEIEIDKIEIFLKIK